MKTAPGGGGGGGLNDFQRPGKAGSHPNRTKSPASITTPLPGTPRMSRSERWWPR